MILGTIKRRHDGTFEVTRNGYPYHVVEADPLYPECHAHAAAYPELVENVPAPVPYMPSLPEIVAAKRAEIQQEKCRARDGGFVVDGIPFDSDLPARTAYAELAIVLQQDPTLTTRWRASDGQWVTMDAALFQRVHAAGRAHIEGCFAWQEAKEQEISAATALAETDEPAARAAIAAIVPIYNLPEAG